jgi:hypothetical protein
LISDVKRWLVQSVGDNAVKNLAFLDAICDVARRPSNPPGSSPWLTEGRRAWALWASGRYRLAASQFDRALAALVAMPGGISALSGDLRQLAWDVCAARAECWAYLGFPQEAIEELSLIPAADRRPWYEWSRAFALHQLAFAERAPFGTDPGVPAHAPGEEVWYRESNRLIEQVKPRLSAAHQFDVELLRAANLGAICRRRRLKGGDWAVVEREAKAALAVFMKAPSPSSNATWSWQKERRGRFPVIELPIDPVSAGPAVRTWRQAYLEHYHANLRQAGLPELSPAGVSDDGEIDPIEDHTDDRAA